MATEVDTDTEAKIAALSSSKQPPIRVMSWEQLQGGTAASLKFSQLMDLMREGLPEGKQDWPTALKAFHNHRQLAITPQAFEPPYRLSPPYCSRLPPG